MHQQGEAEEKSKADIVAQVEGEAEADLLVTREVEGEEEVDVVDEAVVHAVMVGDGAKGHR